MWAIAIVFAVLLGWIGAVARLDAWWIAKRNVEEIEPVRNEEPLARKNAFSRGLRQPA